MRGPSLAPLPAAFITGGMLLTAAKFYGSPTLPNARLLFRASLLHLPIFMAAFLLHRQPNTGEDRAALLAHNARLLGLGGPLTDEEREQQQLGWAAGSGGADGARVRFSLPPLPFLGPLPLGLQLSCPSKASCEEGGEEQCGADANAEYAEGGEQQREQQPADDTSAPTVARGQDDGRSCSP